MQVFKLCPSSLSSPCSWIGTLFETWLQRIEADIKNLCQRNVLSMGVQYTGCILTLLCLFDLLPGEFYGFLVQCGIYRFQVKCGTFTGFRFQCGILRGSGTVCSAPEILSVPPSKRASGKMLATATCMLEEICALEELKKSTMVTSSI